MASSAQQNKQLVQDFLKQNNVKEGWQKIILQNQEVWQALQLILQNEALDRETWILSPFKQRVLAAFSYHEPQDTKVVVIGTAPMSNPGADGLAFSSQESLRNPYTGKAVRLFSQVFHGDVAVQNHSRVWLAEKGVLLLNVALTIPAGKESFYNIKKHCALWKEFLAKLLSTWLNITERNHPLVVIPLGHPNTDGINFAGGLMTAIQQRLDRSMQKDVRMMRQRQDGHYEAIQTSSSDTPVYVFPSIHHPTFPRQNNQFMTQIIPILDYVNQVHPGLIPYTQQGQLR